MATIISGDAAGVHTSAAVEIVWPTPPTEVWLQGE
jgi:hypothetical protein